ncbi:hypothetical protein CHS0354_038124 [Potamilus streckersoni]|uniref:Uncharacterized protein n=1 Tax=Potamilus streckersoni TaxID=2493646 RepID=A0AAE0VXQ8_9BIVA|nr:hypothetical protein CHS0354_038124 [Potamilus streckersoni]
MLPQGGYGDSVLWELKGCGTQKTVEYGDTARPEDNLQGTNKSAIRVVHEPDPTQGGVLVISIYSLVRDACR